MQVIHIVPDTRRIAVAKATVADGGSVAFSPPPYRKGCGWTVVPNGGATVTCYATQATVQDVEDDAAVWLPWAAGGVTATAGDELTDAGTLFRVDASGGTATVYATARLS